MFQGKTFTGSSRRPRQVNLSGRTPNPFAAVSSTRPSFAGIAAQNTVAVAQQERLARQQERDRLNASRLLQRTWRGHRSRKETHQIWREEWDISEQQRLGRPLDFREDARDEDFDLPDVGPILSETDCWIQLKQILQFINIRDRTDIMRLDYFSHFLQSTLAGHPPGSLSEAWVVPLLRLGDLVLKIMTMRERLSLPPKVSANLFDLLTRLAWIMSSKMRRYSVRYYKLLADITKDPNLAFAIPRPSLINSVLALIQPLNDNQTPAAYRDFAMEYLSTPEMVVAMGNVDDLANGLNYKTLSASIIPLLRDLSTRNTPSLIDGERRLWLLASVIYFHRHAHGSHDTKFSSEPDFIEAVSILLGTVADEVAERIDVEDSRNGDSDDPSSRGHVLKPLPKFVREEILTLLDQNRVKGLLAGITAAPQPVGSTTSASDEAKILASYALTLIRVFPNNGNAIRLWLFLGSTSRSKFPISAVKYFFTASEATNTFRVIQKDHRAALDLLKPNLSEREEVLSSSIRKNGITSQDWRVILIFLELYSYVLQVMDDEEFLSGGSPLGSAAVDVTGNLRQSALPLQDVQRLTMFLKNLAFTLYWNGSSILGSDSKEDVDSLRNYFSPTVLSLSAQSIRLNDTKSKTEQQFSELVGASFKSLKLLVTGILRMIYERDSRRKFLPKDFWLMTGRFDMEGFIPAVVAEHQAREIRKREIGDNGDVLEEADEEFDDSGFEQPSHLVGNNRARRMHHHEYLAKKQRQASREKYLQAVAPRLEILENMPFFIPFETRVQVFRQFIVEDQIIRRNGMIDPDNWRMSIMANAMRSNGGLTGHEIIGKHHANIHRESVFEDAYDQFFSLGEGLKEPIQITFVDKFDTVEAGIDGGGVTKEFLTSVTSEAFGPANGLKMFLENDQHLLYPNPVSIEQRYDLLRQAGLKEGSADWNHHVRELLKRYEFLGRVIGKCLYEGILVDVSFVGFFLLKWALTGGANSAAKETSYRPSFNDLRDLDEGLYQGLLQLKNYAGDVEDFALNFTITDTIPLEDVDSDGVGGSSRTITRDLGSNGSDILVNNQNRLLYIQYVARHRLQNQPKAQTNAFLKGLQQIITPSWLSMFNQAELQTLVSGVSAEIDVADLRKNTLYGGLYVIGDDNEEHPTIKLFWEVMQSIPDTDRRQVLKFVTSTPRAPLLGFSHLNPQFSIRDSSSDQDRLPSTSTCVNLLKLPRYSSAEILKEKLLYAVNAGAGFDLS